jgi:predicted esterase
MSKMAHCHIVSPEIHKYTIILLHGRDQFAQDFQSELFESQDAQGIFLQQLLPDVKWIFPEAEETLWKRTGMFIRQWFDMYMTEKPHEQEADSLDELLRSADQIIEIVRREAAVIGMESVLLGGISQGCATAVVAMLRGDLNVAGFAGFSTWMPSPTHFAAVHPDQGKMPRQPVLLQHCSDDDVIDIKYGRELQASLNSLGMEVSLVEYSEGGHWINEPDGIEAFVAFAKKCLHIQER